MAQMIYEREPGGVSFFKSRVGWGAIFAGVVVAMVTQAILFMLGLAIGFAAVNPTQPNFNIGAIGMGSMVWVAISALISAFVGGWVATSLANVNNRFDGMLHGILSWGLFMVVALSLLGSGLGSVVGGTFNLASGVVSGASTGIASNVVRRQTGVAAVREKVQAIKTERVTQQYNPQAQAGMERRTEQAANTASKAAWGAFLISLLSLVASAVGGVAGLKSQRNIVRSTV